MGRKRYFWLRTVLLLGYGMGYLLSSPIVYAAPDTQATPSVKSKMTTEKSPKKEASDTQAQASTAPSKEPEATDSAEGQNNEKIAGYELQDHAALKPYVDQRRYSPFSKRKKKKKTRQKRIVGPSCKSLIQGSLDAAHDGRVNQVCEVARLYCFAYQSLLFLESSGKSPEYRKAFKRMRPLYKKLSEETRIACYMARKAAESEQFMREVDTVD